MKRYLVALLLLAACTSPLDQVDIPLSEIEQQPFVATLENGLTVTVREMHSLPLVSIQFWVHVGSRNEPENKKGIAHVFEHMWFKGTDTQEVGSFHKRVEKLGGELNAMTSHDWTSYFVTVPSDKFDDIFPYMVDLLRNPLFDEVELKKELEVVVEEQRMSFNTPERSLDDLFGLSLIDKHPYRHPIIGYKETILSIERDEVIDFYNTWYVPNNMNIVVAGDVSSLEIVDKINTAFTDFKPRELPELILPEELPITTPRYNSTSRDIGFNYLAIGFVGPPSGHPDYYPMRVFNMIFAESESSRLQEIVKKQKNLIVRGLSVFVGLNDMGVFEMITVVDPEKRNDATAELLVQLNRFKFEPVTDEELARAKRLIRAQHVKNQEEVFDVGHSIGQAWVDGTLDEYAEYLDKIDAVTKEDIQDVLNKYFTSYTIAELKPKL